VLLEGFGELKKLNYLIGTRTLDLPACSTVPQPTKLLRAPTYKIVPHNSIGHVTFIQIQVVPGYENPLNSFYNDGRHEDSLSVNMLTSGASVVI
jgi:hypothetical protein